MLVYNLQSWANSFHKNTLTGEEIRDTCSLGIFGTHEDAFEYIKEAKNLIPDNYHFYISKEILDPNPEDDLSVDGWHYSKSGEPCDVDGVVYADDLEEDKVYKEAADKLAEETENLGLYERKVCSFEFEKIDDYNFEELTWASCCDDFYDLVWEGGVERGFYESLPEILFRFVRDNIVKVDFCPFCGAKIEIDVWKDGKKVS